MDRDTFVARFGGVFEHSPWIAERAWDQGHVSDTGRAETVHHALCRVLREASRDEQLELIRSHPDLGLRQEAMAELTRHSRSEQHSAGLDTLDEAERTRFVELNRAYRKKFGFPFVMAVKGREKAEILATLERRLSSEPEAEFDEALAQIEQIALLRLREILP